VTHPLAERLSRLTPQQRAELARQVRQRATAARANGVATVPRIERSGGRLPMSSAQRRLYFLQNLHPESPAYNNVEAVRLRGCLDLGALRAALAAVVARHELLRTTCVAAPEPALLLARRPEVGLDVVDLSTMDGAASRARALFAAHADRPFDLDAGAPLRVTLARLADDDHALLFVIHHVASDAWSCRLLLRDFFRAYTAAVTGTADGSAPPAVQYADYAAWHDGHLDTGAMRAHHAYWRDRLAGLPPVLELPLDRPRPPVRSDRGAEIHLDLDDGLRERLHAAARAAAVTPFAVLLTAFGYVLHRHCGTADVAVGTPVSGRARVEFEDVVGCFINTVVLRLDLRGAPTRRALVRRVWDGVLHDLEHQSLPFEQLVAARAADRDRSAGQVVQVLFNHYPATEVTEPVPGLSVAPFDVERVRAKFDLTCTVVDHSDRMRVTLNHATEIVGRDLAVRLGGHFAAVLEDLIADLDASPATLPAVPPEDPVEPPPAVKPRAGRPLLERFEEHVKAGPGRAAVRCPGGAVTYRELNGRANRLAHYLLRRKGSGPIALLFERSADYVVAMLAALKAGRTYVPLDPTMPAGHVAAVLRAAGCDVLLTHAEAAVAAAAAAVDAAAPVAVIVLEEIAAELSRCGAADPGRRTVPDDTMYVLFTSGSTGRPKGVVVEHRHFTAYLTAVLDRMGLTDRLSFAIVSTFAADLGLTNLFGALATGGTLHVLPYEWATDPDRFAAYFRRHRVDVMKLVPSHLKALAEHGVLDAVVPARHLVLAGEACPWDLVDSVRAVRPQCTVWNHYGPTETTVSVLAYRVPDPPPPDRGATVPLGFPLDHVRVRVVDGDLRPVPRGAPGELLIAGGSVARGYLEPDGPAATAFVRDPFGAGPGERAYRSGDRARVRADGAVEFLGRLDRQAKIRGYRVEPGHVEAVLRRHPAVSEVAVAVRPDRNGRAALVAYYREDHNNGAAAPSIADFARSNLPSYLVPGAYVVVQRLPLTPNGKLDWAALPEPDPGSRRDGHAPVPPRDERDSWLAGIWCEVLGLERVGIDDDFFESGGDSFSAMKLARRIGAGVRVVAVFQHPTVRRLVDHLDRGDGDGLLHRLPSRPGGAAVTTTATVVAVPFGGATGGVYRDLAAALPPEFPLYAVELPGHDPAARDRPLEPFAATAERCCDEIRRTIRGPVMVYGHCVGAALAFEIADRLAAGGADVVGVVAGGAFPAPRLPGRLFDLWARVLPSDRWRADRLYRDLLRATGGFTEVLDPGEQAAVLRALRHDARESEELYSRRCHDPRHRRTIPGLSVVGERDRITEFHRERYREWNLLCADTDLAVIPDAGHYFLKHQAGRLADIIVRWCGDRLAAGSVPPDPPAPPEAPAARAAANLRGFALVTLGQLVSLVGSRALAFALGIWVYLQTGSATQFSVILVTALLPGLVALPFAGAAADRWNRRLLMILGETLNAAGTGLCLVMYATGSLAVWHIYVAASLGSVATAFQQPAYLAAIAQLVPKQYLGRTNGVVQAVVAVSQAVGPLVGGTLIVLVGLGGVMLVDLATVLVAVATLIAVRFPALLFRRRDESLWSEIRGGLHYIARRRPFVAMVEFFLAYNLILGFALALLPPMVLAFSSAATLSVATMIGAIGGIAGGVVMALWGGFERRATGMIGFVALTGVGMVVAGLRPAPVFPVLGLAAIMASIALINGHWQTMIQVKVGMELQGRILATNRMIANLTEPLGYVGAGWLADAILEPAMADGAWLRDASGLVDAGPGRGMALVIVLLGGALIALAVAGLRWRTLRYMEDALPDAIPGATATWDRDALQREADLLLSAARSTRSWRG
jgi:amino acid adenylation domain-containing protein